MLGAARAGNAKKIAKEKIVVEEILCIIF